MHNLLNLVISKCEYPTYAPILAHGFPSEATAAFKYVLPLLGVFSLSILTDFDDVNITDFGDVRVTLSLTFTTGIVSIFSSVIKSFVLRYDRPIPRPSIKTKMHTVAIITKTWLFWQSNLLKWNNID